MAVEIERSRSEPSGDHLEGLLPAEIAGVPAVNVIAGGLGLLFSNVLLRGAVAFGVGYALRRKYFCR